MVDSYSWNNVTTSVSSTWNNYFGENTDDDAAAAADAAVEAANNNNNYNYNDDNANDANDDNDNDNDDGGDDNAAADDYAVAAAAAADDYAAADDNGDDYAAANDNDNGDDYNAYYADDDDNDNDNDQAADDNDQAAEEEADDWAAREAQDDDLFQWDGGKGFDEVSMMPISCVNYNNGHMIKLQFFDTQNSYQCHFGEIGTFVVSIAHYMRAYFNHQALVMGKEFSLPGDAGYLNVSVALHCILFYSIVFCYHVHVLLYNSFSPSLSLLSTHSLVYFTSRNGLLRCSNLRQDWLHGSRNLYVHQTSPAFVHGQQMQYSLR